MDITVDNENYRCFLGDNGTLDTVVIVYSPSDEKEEGNREEVVISQEWAANFREQNGSFTDQGFRDLAEWAIDDLNHDLS